MGFHISAHTTRRMTYVSITHVGPLIFMSSFVPDGTDTWQSVYIQKVISSTCLRKRSLQKSNMGSKPEAILWTLFYGKDAFVFTGLFYKVKKPIFQ